MENARCASWSIYPRVHGDPNDISRPAGHRNAQELAALSRKKYHELVRKNNATCRAKRASWC